ncbi:hypothetical protein M422DRAFT_273082 [Sphaerobolus stellatus SS14]|uniref:Uncharacterized protein n=1 Tax=Sphaerobolus stellatus (strain SS14) TaxID=990650 RepID=A0A0C9UKH7_SPHS4|nr:hypothetical protein M422DRAFT_273082 [Sphaerobolus stellatus SS14]
MAHKKKTNDKVPTGTSDAINSGSTTTVIGEKDPTLDPGKDSNQVVSTTSEMNIPCPMTWKTCANNMLTKTANKLDSSENTPKTANPHRGDRDLPPAEKSPVLPEPNNVDEESMNNQCNIDLELISSAHPVDPEVWAKLMAKTAILEWLYADNAPTDHLNPAAAAATRGTCMEYEQLLRLSKAGLLNDNNPHD